MSAVPDFSDLEDPAFSNPAAEGTAAHKVAESWFAHRPASKRVPNPKPKPQYPCTKCNGSGKVTFGYVNIRQGKCFRCNGKGYFTSSPEQRQAKRESYQARKDEQSARAAKLRSEFLQARPDVAKWFVYQIHRNNEFAISLDSKLTAYGELTERQLAAIESSIKRDAEWKAKREADEAAQVSDPNALRLTIPEGMYAVPGGETRLKVRIDKPEEGKWKGFVFVKDGAEYGRGERYGMQKPNSVYVGKISDELRIIQANPEAASVAYGRLTGTCGRCGRKLEDAASIAAGIGPICAMKEW